MDELTLVDVTSWSIPDAPISTLEELKAFSLRSPPDDAADHIQLEDVVRTAHAVSKVALLRLADA